MPEETSLYDVVIVGGGTSGTALLYTLAQYSTVLRIALVEKYGTLGSVNSHAHNNSQTLHVGDIETNYSIEKVREVKPAALMVAEYVERLPLPEQKEILVRMQKMVLGVGENEVQMLEERYETLKHVFPELQKLDRDEIERVEPNVMQGRPTDEKVIALFNPNGYAVNFGVLAASLAKEAVRKRPVNIYLKREVTSIRKEADIYILSSAEGELRARAVVVDADAYSLGFAKKLGYGRHYSLLAIAGTFYFTKELLHGKVYTVQAPRLPFASVHGDPDMTVPGKTRFGPTARFLPILESRRLSSMPGYLMSSGLHRPQTWISFLSIVIEPIRFLYFIKNFAYEWPWVGKYFFAPQVRKIVPTLRARDLTRAKGFGGMRLQRVDTDTRELLLGEGKIIGENIIFNMTPSPGASVCLYNAMRDAETLSTFFGGEFNFDKNRMLTELSGDLLTGKEDISIKETYPA